MKTLSRVVTLFAGPVGAVSTSAAPNDSKATARVVSVGALPFAETVTHPQNGELWYQLDATGAGTGAWYECTIQITHPINNNRVGHRLEMRSGDRVLYSSGKATTQDAVLWAVAFIQPGQSLHAVTVPPATGTGASATYAFEAKKIAVASEVLSRSNAAPFTRTESHPGGAVVQEWRYTAPVAGNYRFTIEATNPSIHYFWDLDTYDFFGGYGPPSTNRVLPAPNYSVCLAAGQVYSFYFFQMDYNFFYAGFPMTYKVTGERQESCPTATFVSATPASGAAPFTTTLRFRLMDDVSGVDTDGSAPHSFVTLMRGTTTIGSVNITAAHLVSGNALDGIYDIPFNIPAGTATGSLHAEFIVVDLLPSSAVYSFTAIATVGNFPPPNDNFANAAVLTTGVPATANNAYATMEQGEVFPPGHDAVSYNRTVWWNGTAPSGRAYFKVTSSASTYDNVLSVFTGGSVSTLTPVGDTAGDTGGGNDETRIFAAVPGTIYRIAVAGFGPFAGPIQLLITPASLSDLNYPQWKDAVYGSATIADTADPDRDGVPVIFEYFLNGGPTTSDALLLPQAFMSGGKLHFRYTSRRNSGFIDDVTGSPTLAGPWTSLMMPVDLVNHGTTETVTWRYNGTAPRYFLRLELAPAAP